MNKKINLFNNEIEMGLRILVVLETIYPKSLDIEMINYYDYFILHTKDIGGEESLHPAMPNRFGELVIKRELIHEGLKLLISKGLVEVKYTNDGIEYIASDVASPFLDNLESRYTQELSNNAQWVCLTFEDFSYAQIKEFVDKNKTKWGSELSYCTAGLNDE